MGWPAGGHIRLSKICPEEPVAGFPEVPSVFERAVLPQDAGRVRGFEGSSGLSGLVSAQHFVAGAVTVLRDERGEYQVHATPDPTQQPNHGTRHVCPGQTVHVKWNEPGGNGGSTLEVVAVNRQFIEWVDEASRDPDFRYAMGEKDPVWQQRPGELRFMRRWRTQVVTDWTEP